MMERREPTNLTGADYAVFVIMLLISAAIGVYFGYRNRKAKGGVQEYLMGGRNMSFFPVGVSLSLSFVSAVTILGTPVEIYMYGSMYLSLVFGAVLICTLPVTEIFIPIFYRLGISSSFEYLQLRYNYGVRLVATAAYLLQNVMYIGIMIYAPAVALTAVTNLNVWASIFTIGLVCTFYTTLGGLKAVIWTDVFQGFIVLLGTSATLFASASRAGGWDRVWRLNHETERIDFGRFDGDVRVRHSFWSITIGLGFLWMSVYGTSQSQVQRYLCCRTEEDAKKGVWMSMVISALILVFSTITGFVMYAYFHDCDPLLNNEISAPDQLLPYMVMDVFRDYPGLPGLFIASVFSGCLSTVSSGINAMACVTVEDFIRPFVKWRERTLTRCSQALVLTYGLLCIGFACLSSLLGGVLQSSLSVMGVIAGPLLGIFSIGIVFPCVNSKGGCAGVISGMFLTSWMYIGSRQYPPLPEFTRPKMRLINGCPDPSSIILPTPPDAASRPDIANNFYAVSYAYYTAIGYAATLGVGLLVSLCTGGYQTRKDVHPKLIKPLLDHRIFRPWLPEKFRRFMRCGVEHDKIEPHKIVEVTTERDSSRLLMRRRSSRDLTNSLRMSRRHWREDRDAASIPSGSVKRSNPLMKDNTENDISTVAISNTTLSAEYILDSNATDAKKFSRKNRTNSSTTLTTQRQESLSNRADSTLQAGTASIWL